MPAAVAAVVVGAFLWSIAPPPVQDLNPQASLITVRNESFWAANASVARCSGAIGRDMPYQAFALAGVTFTMHRVSCFAPGGGAIQGEAARPGGPSWPFSIGGLQIPDDDGFVTKLSPDQRVGVRSGGNLTLLVHA